MIRAETFLEAACRAGFSLYTGVPCSYLKPLINAVIDAEGLRYVGATNEGDAVAIASGAALGGRKAVVLFQNSGLGNAVNPLTSLNMVFRLPVLIICTLRGEPGGPPDEPQHALMGPITTGLFDLMGIPWGEFPRTEDAIAPALAAAEAAMAGGLPYALVVRSGSLEPRALERAPAPRSIPAPLPAPAWPSEAPTRMEALAAIQRHARPDDLIVATTGFTGRALYALDDRPNQLYMVGSMGCAGSLGLGLAIARPDRRVVVIDGDGAALMRLGALATIGYERPANLVHVLLDNEAHDSTGGQATVSHSVDLAAIARACGYPRVERLASAEALGAALGEGLSFLHVKTRLADEGKLPRPTITPAEVARRFMAALAPVPSA